MLSCLVPVKAAFVFWHWNEMTEQHLYCYLLLRLKWLPKYHWAQGIDWLPPSAAFCYVYHRYHLCSSVTALTTVYLNSVYC